MVRLECGKLVGGIEFAVQQKGERHKDSRLYWGSWNEQCSQESAGVRGESEGFLWWSAGCHRENGEMSRSCRARRGKEDGICDEGDSRVRIE